MHPSETSNLAIRWPARFPVAAAIGLGLLLACLTATVHGAAAPEPMDPTKSVFVDDPNFGKDPFFPRSSRRGKRTPVVTETNGVVSVPDDLILKGLSGTPE